MSWVSVPFESLYATPSRNGISVAKSQHDGETKIVNMGELFAADFIGDIPMRRIKVEKKQLAANELSIGDLLFARRSLVASGAGKVSMVSDLKEPTVFESSIIRVRLDQTKAIPRFYAYWFRSPAGKDAISRLVTGTNVKGIRGSELRSIQVPALNLDAQQRIASILMAYDNLIKNNHRQIALLEEAAQRLYKEWFVDLRFPSHKSVEIIEGVPRGWQKKPLEECLDKEIGGGWGQEASSHEYPEIGYVIRATDIADVEGGNITSVPLRWHKTSNIRPRTLEAGDIIFEVSGGSREHGVGRSMLVTKEELDAFGKPVICASFCKRIKPKQGLSLLLAECISYEYNTEGLRKFEKRSAGNIINYHWKPFLAEYNVLIPDGDTLAAFEKQVGQIRDKKSRAAQAIRFAREARERLLPRLMSGEIEVEG